MEASFDWVTFTIDRPMAQEPGAGFKYNSGATQLLSHIFRTVNHTDVEEYARRHLFAPLGIERHFWKRSPTGLPDTEGGLYLRPRDLAKISYVFMKDGVWDGRLIVRPDWVKASLAPSVTVSANVKYGYKWWLHSYGKDGTRVAWARSRDRSSRPVSCRPRTHRPSSAGGVFHMLASAATTVTSSPGSIGLAKCI